MTDKAKPAPTTPTPNDAERTTALDIRLAAEVLSVAIRLGFVVADPRAPGRPGPYAAVDPDVLAAKAALGREIRSSVSRYSCAVVAPKAKP